VHLSTPWNQLKKLFTVEELNESGVVNNFPPEGEKALAFLDDVTRSRFSQPSDSVNKLWIRRLCQVSKSC